MSTLEKVMQMKQTGAPEQEIIQSLKQQGISPKEINEALSQSTIKSALTNQDAGTTETNDTMQPSIMQQQPEEPAPQQEYENQIPSSYKPSTQPYDEQVPAPDQYATQEQYYPEYQPQQQIDIQTVNDIAEQIAEEKTNKLKKEILTITRFKEETSSEVKRIDERLKKIESTIDSLQAAILRKIGDYGEDIKNISREMHETQNSFSKILNPLTDNIRELQRITGKTQERSQENENLQTKQQENKNSEQQPQRKKSKKSEPSFEDYLR
jgi:hypothetical protein